ncbi:unnamed protein product [Urochloa decumbens]|uniref:signal peptidase I n=1 Tax=Urochloa decumbens TaxID=240449 RepID=A0ABC9CKI2_9POAL
MDSLQRVVEPIRAMQIRPVLAQTVSLGGMILASALIIWKGLMVVTGTESPLVVVLSESMEPGFKRGDILFLHMNKDPVRAGEIVVFNVDGRDIPIVHRVIKVASLVALNKSLLMLYTFKYHMRIGLSLLISLYRFMNAMIQLKLISSQKVTIILGMTDCYMHMDSFGFSNSTLWDGLLAICLMLGGLQLP